MNIEIGIAGRGGVGGRNDFGGCLLAGKIGVVGRGRVGIAIDGARDATAQSMNA
jgi:hypothetical protein